jgi:hypothetical protein
MDVSGEQVYCHVETVKHHVSVINHHRFNSQEFPPEVLLTSEYNF